MPVDDGADPGAPLYPTDPNAPPETADPAAPDVPGAIPENPTPAERVLADSNALPVAAGARPQAGGGARLEGVRNPPFDTMFINGGPWSKNILHGKIIATDGPYSGAALHFLYNPQAIEYSYAIGPTTYYDSLSAGERAGLPPAGPTSLGFQLLFDRTYEIYKDVLKEGVRHDVEMLLRICGWSPEIASLAPTPVDVFFGGTETMQFYGLITSVGVSFGMFSNMMVPMRCAVNLGMYEIPRGVTSLDAGVGGIAPGVGIDPIVDETTPTSPAFEAQHGPGGVRNRPTTPTSPAYEGEHGSGGTTQRSHPAYGGVGENRQRYYPPDGGGARRTRGRTR